jgi:hypothetical protein
MLTQKDYISILEKSLDNYAPKRIVEYLEHRYSKSKNDNPHYWIYLQDEIKNRYSQLYDGDDYINIETILKEDHEFFKEGDAYAFINAYCTKRIEEQLKKRHYKNRRFTIKDLSTLISWLNERKIDPNNLRHKLQRYQINPLTSQVLKIVFEDNLLKEEELLALDKRNLSLFIKLYFSLAVNESERLETDEVIFTDYRKSYKPLLYRTIRNDNRRVEYSEIFRRSFDKANQELNLGWGKFKEIETKRWKRLKAVFDPLTTEYDLINKYISFLPKISPFKKVVNQRSFGVSKEKRLVIQKIIQEIEEKADLRFLNKARSGAEDFANTLTATDFALARPIYFSCETYYVVYLFKKILEKFSSNKFSASTIAKSNLFFIPTAKFPSSYSSTKDFKFKQLSRTNVHIHITRLEGSKDRVDKRVLSKIEQVLRAHKL